MPSPYHFCFCFSRITLDGPAAARLGVFTTFKMELLLEKQPVGATGEVLCAPNPQGEIVMESEFILFESEGRQGGAGSACEIRLMEVGECGRALLVGCYEFQLGNYVRAHQELNRSCIELNVQIGVGFVLSYEVYLERTLEALRKVIHEHEAARKLALADCNSSDFASFLPQEMANEHMQGNFKQIHLDSSPLLLNQRFWSPRRRRVRKTRTSSKITSSNSIDQSGSTHSGEDVKLTFMRVKKTESSQMEMRVHDTQHSQTAINLNSQLFEKNIENEEEMNQQNYVQLYQVIRTDSKITLPQHPQQSDRTLQRSTSPNTVMNSSKRTAPIKNNAKQYIFIFLAVLLLALAAAFLFQRSQESSRKMRLHRKIKGRKSH